MSLRSSRLSGSLAIRIAVTSNSKVERASTGDSSSSSTRALRRRSSSASPGEYCRRVRAAGPRVGLCFAMIHPPHCVGRSTLPDGHRLASRYTLKKGDVSLKADTTLCNNETRLDPPQTALRDLLRRHVPAADVDSRLA